MFLDTISAAFTCIYILKTDPVRTIPTSTFPLSIILYKFGLVK